MADYQLPQLAKDAQRLRTDIENAVLRFPQFHKYEMGREIRVGARRVRAYVRKSWDAEKPEEKLPWVQRLVDAIDQLQEDLQAAREVAAMTGRTFEHLYRQAKEVGRQAGAWLRKLERLLERLNIQNAGSKNVPAA